MTMDEAYRVQLGLLDGYLASGDRHTGWKVGPTAKAMQMQQKVHVPCSRFLVENGNKPTGTVFEFAACSTRDERSRDADCDEPGSRIP